MASNSDDGFIVLICQDHDPIEVDHTQREILISHEEIDSWELPTILSYQTIKVEANRKRLREQSSYFHGLLSGSFRDSYLDCISIRWNLEALFNVLKFIHGCSVNITSNNFLPLFEAALYFGVETLLFKCKSWFSEVTSFKDLWLLQIPLDDLIPIWNFSLEHANDFLPELCTGYLARNFMWAISCCSFCNVPYTLLLSCVNHPQLTIDSEKHLSDALLVWLHANSEHAELLSSFEENCPLILKQVRISLLPLSFAAGKRKCCYFSKLADESIDAIFSLMEHPSKSSMIFLGDVELFYSRIRLTEYTEKVDLSGCPQLTSAILLLSVLPFSYGMDPKLRKSIEQTSIKLEHIVNWDRYTLSRGLPMLSFEAVKEVDISKCPRLHLEAAIECFCKSFPSLKAFKAVYLSNFKISTLRQLMQKCPLVSEVDLTVDITPVVPSQVSVISSSPDLMPQGTPKPFSDKDYPLDTTRFFLSRPLLPNITKLTLEGRSDVLDSNLQDISKYCLSLCHLNLKGCIMVTDVGISNLIRRCIKLHSVVVCDTSFGKNSVLALCSVIPNCGDSPAAEQRDLASLSFTLQTLHMGGCKGFPATGQPFHLEIIKGTLIHIQVVPCSPTRISGNGHCSGDLLSSRIHSIYPGVDEADLLKLISQTYMLRSLCLRGTHIVDHALYSFLGSSLEMLDVSDTTVSGAALAHMVRGNPGLKCLKARGCINLFQQEFNAKGKENPLYKPCKELYFDLGQNCKLEELALGWGFTRLTFEALRPAILSLRTISVGLGGSLGQDALTLLPTICPSLECVILCFQVISDSILIAILECLRHLQVLALSYCLGDISSSSFMHRMPTLRALRLERVTPWMTNDDLVILTQNCANLIELSLLGCMLLNSDSQQIISHGWPGLTSIHLEDCGEVTANGVTSLLDCKALEELLLRHNGCGIQGNFILSAASRMPMLRKISLDLCDASEDDFQLPNYVGRYSLSIVKIARCKSQICGLDLQALEPRRRAVHMETLVLAWNSKNLIRTVVKERV